MGFCFFLADIEDIGQIFEGIKGNPNGQGKLRMGKGNPEDPTNRIQKKAIVFEKTKDQKIHSDYEYKIPSGSRFVILDTFHFHSHKIMKNGAEQHQDHVNRFSPGIEEKTSQHQKQIFQFLGNQIIKK